MIKEVCQDSGSKAVKLYNKIIGSLGKQIKYFSPHFLNFCNTAVLLRKAIWKPPELGSYQKLISCSIQILIMFFNFLSSLSAINKIRKSRKLCCKQIPQVLSSVDSKTHRTTDAGSEFFQDNKCFQCPQEDFKAPFSAYS